MQQALSLSLSLSLTHSLRARPLLFGLLYALNPKHYTPTHAPSHPPPSLSPSLSLLSLSERALAPFPPSPCIATPQNTAPFEQCPSLPRSMHTARNPLFRAGNKPPLSPPTPPSVHRLHPPCPCLALLSNTRFHDRAHMQKPRCCSPLCPAFPFTVTLLRWFVCCSASAAQGGGEKNTRQSRGKM